MNVRAVTHVVAALVVLIGGCILTSVPVSWLMGDGSRTIVLLLVCALIPAAIGAPVAWFTRSKGLSRQLGVREGFGIVTFGWVAAAAFGCIPFVIISDIYWYDAFFETMSGFTTTGASVLDDQLLLQNGEKLKSGIADLPKGLLYWRSTTHWLGGMGIVVLSLAILPFLGIGGQQLYNAEVPGFIPDQLTPRIASSAKILWGVYVLLSVAEAVLLWAGGYGMSLFDAWCHTCGTMATGGFSTQQSSVGQYGSVYFDCVITLFMFLAGCNFVLHFRALRGKPICYFKDEEFRTYLVVTLIAILSIAFLIMGSPIKTTTGAQVPGSFGNSLRYSAFQVVSIMTTTGFATADFDVWPAYAGLLLVTLMFAGGCGGSTGGGIKYSRLILLVKCGIANMRRSLFPHVISNVRINRARIDRAMIAKVMGFFFLFMFLFIAFALILTLTSEEMDIITASTASVACLANIGPGLGKVGATCTYSWMSPFAKTLLTVAMLLGRLEVYTVLVVLLPTFWRK